MVYRFQVYAARCRLVFLRECSPRPLPSCVPSLSTSYAILPRGNMGSRALQPCFRILPCSCRRLSPAACYLDSAPGSSSERSPSVRIEAGLARFWLQPCVTRSASHISGRASPLRFECQAMCSLNSVCEFFQSLSHALITWAIEGLGYRDPSGHEP